MRCKLCGEPVDMDDPKTYFEVIGFVHGPKADGMKLRERTGHAAHEKCIELTIRGQAVDQPQLFTDEEQA